MNFGNIVIMMSKWAQSRETLRSGGSRLYTCKNCQKYLQAAQNVAKSQGKIIEFKFIAHPDAKNIPKLNIILNP